MRAPSLGVLASCLVVVSGCAGARTPPAPAPLLVRMSSTDPAERDFRDLSPFAEALAGARVVVLGESRHADADAIAARIRLVEWLHEDLGFDVLAWEAGLFGASEMDAALHDPARLGEDVRALGLPAQAASLRDTLAIFDYARSTSSSAHPLHIVGFDINMNAASALERYRAFLSARADAAHVFSPELRAEVLAAFERFPKTSRFLPLSSETRSLDRASFAALRAAMVGAELTDRDLVLQTLDDVDALYRWHEAVGADRSTTIPWVEHVALNNVRDAAMAANVLFQLERAPNRRIVVWVANVHASRTVEGLDITGTTLPPGALDGYHPMGEHLARALGDELYVIATTAYAGYVGSPTGEPVPIGPAPEGSLEARLVGDGLEVAIVDLGAPSRASAPETALFVGYEPMRATWSRVFDGALFIRTMHPATVAP